MTKDRSQSSVEPDVNTGGMIYWISDKQPLTDITIGAKLLGQISRSFWLQRFLTFVALSFLITACAQQPPTPPHSVTCSGISSPDQQLRACVLSVGRHPNPPFNESRVEIRDMTGSVLATKDFKSPDGEHGRNVQKTEWSTDSQFFVFSTASSGGHSPWHWQTYFYDRKRKIFKEVDDFTGPVIKRNFKLSAPDSIEVQVQGTSSDPMDIVKGHPERRRLSALH